MITFHGNPDVTIHIEAPGYGEFLAKIKLVAGTQHRYHKALPFDYGRMCKLAEEFQKELADNKG